MTVARDMDEDKPLVVPEFGTFLYLTIAFSWLFANLGFMNCLAQFGGCGHRSPVSAIRRQWWQEQTEEGGGDTGTLTTEAVVC